MLAYSTIGGAPAMMAARLLNPSYPRGILKSQIPPIQRWHRLGRSGLHTFDPARLQPSDYLDVAGTACKQLLSTKEYPSPWPTILYLRGYSPRMSRSNRRVIPFPPDTRGFLYYHPPSGHPPLDEGHLRFRITEGSDPASFSRGKDLLYPDGEPWNLVGGRIAATTMYVPLRRMLLDDGLVTEAQLDAWGSRYDSRGMRQNGLNDLEAPFVIDFALAAHTFHIPISPHSDNTRRYVFIHPLTVQRARELSDRVSLCTGRAICRFESAGVHGRDKQSRVVLRLLKVLNPLEPSEEALKRGIVFDRPKEGEIFLRTFRGGPWTRLTKHNALHALWER